MEWIPIFEQMDEDARMKIVRYECSKCCHMSYRKYAECPHCKEKYEDRFDEYDKYVANTTN